MASWTIEDVTRRIAERGCIASLGQFDDSIRRQLEKQVRNGTLAKWRACWNAPLGGIGIGPLKTIYGRPELNPHNALVSA